MSQNGQTHFEKLAANAAEFSKVSEHFTALWSKGLKFQNLTNLWKFSGFGNTWFLSLLLDLQILGNCKW